MDEDRTDEDRPDDHRPSSRKQKALDRRQQILTAASAVFAEKGYHRTTTREIAVAADIAEGTIYNYFDSKDDLLIGIITHLKDKSMVEERIQESLPGDARKLFEILMEDRQQFLLQNYDMLKTITAELLTIPELKERYFKEVALPFIENLEQHLKLRTDLGQISAQNNAVTARILMGLSLGLFFLLALGDPVAEQEWNNLPAQITGLIFDGIASGNHLNPGP